MTPTEAHALADKLVKIASDPAQDHGCYDELMDAATGLRSLADQVEGVVIAQEVCGDL